MFFKFVFLFVVLILESFFVLSAHLKKIANDRPIIGILSQEISYHLNQVYPEQYKSFIAASYVKFIEGAGARVMPIWIGKDEAYYENVLREVNGVLFPGGATFFNNSNGYADAGEIIYRVAKSRNDQGDYFPIFGICLGFELITYLEAERVDHRIDCSSSAVALPLEFKSDFRDSRLFKDASKTVINILGTENVTANYHHYCVTEKSLERAKIRDSFIVTSSNRDKNGVEFISTLEHKNYPFYGLQFHPEKNSYEWIENRNIPHGLKATIAGQYFASFFVEEARKCSHVFGNKDKEKSSLIYNYPVTYTALKKSVYMQCYLFDQ